MITFKETTPQDFLSLWQIEQREYPESMRSHSIKEFSASMMNRIGVTLMDGPFIIGCVSFEDSGGTEVIAHCFVLRERFGKWLNRKLLSEVLSIPFRRMNKYRISIPIICGSMPSMEGWLLRVGFKREGLIRKALLLDGTLHDITMLGMVEEDLRFKGVD